MEETEQPESPEAAKQEVQDDKDLYRFGRPPDLRSFAQDAPGRVTDFSGVEVKEIDLSSRSARSHFLDMADPLYAGDPNYISPLRMHFMKFLDPAKNPAFENLEVRALIAYQNGKPVGRMTVHVDRKYNEYHESKSGFFGFFESVNDRKVAHALLQNGVDWLKAKGIEEIFGPMNFTTNHQVGLLVNNFDRPPFVEETYNPRYYEELLTSFGFGKAKDLYVWWVDVTNGLESKKRQRLARIADRVRKREGVSFRQVNMKDAQAEKERIYDIYVKAWEKNWGFVPLSKKEFMFLAADLELIVIPEMFMFAEVNGKPVGFTGTIPNINEVLPRNGRLFPFGWWKFLTRRKKVGHGRLYTLGVIPEYRKRGLEAVMIVETVIRGQAVGFAGGEIGWTLEDNDLINRAIEQTEGYLDRTYRILGLRLTD